MPYTDFIFTLKITFKGGSLINGLRLMLPCRPIHPEVSVLLQQTARRLCDRKTTELTLFIRVYCFSFFFLNFSFSANNKKKNAAREKKLGKGKKNPESAIDLHRFQIDVESIFD